VKRTHFCNAPQPLQVGGLGSRRVWGLGQRPNVKVFVHLFQKVVGERSEGKALLQKKKSLDFFPFTAFLQLFR